MLIAPDSVGKFVNVIKKLYHYSALMKKLANNRHNFVVNNLSDEIHVKNVEMIYDSINVS